MLNFCLRIFIVNDYLNKNMNLFTDAQLTAYKALANSMNLEETAVTEETQAEAVEENK